MGRIGNESRSEYTAIGSVVNLASRLCSSAADGEILVDATAAEAIGAKRHLVSLGRRAIKGYDDELPVFSVVRDNQTRAAQTPAHIQ